MKGKGLLGLKIAVAALVFLAATGKAVLEYENPNKWEEVLEKVVSIVKG